MAREDRRARCDQHGCDLVLEAGGEGYGLDIWGQRQADGTWRFHCNSTSMMLDENDDEQWVGSSRACGPPEEVLEGMRENLFATSGLYVHPEFRDRVWRTVEKLVPPEGDWRRDDWDQHRCDTWKEACGLLPSRWGDGT